MGPRRLFARPAAPAARLVSLGAAVAAAVLLVAPTAAAQTVSADRVDLLKQIALSQALSPALRRRILLALSATPVAHPPAPIAARRVPPPAIADPAAAPRAGSDTGDSGASVAQAAPPQAPYVRVAQTFESNPFRDPPAGSPASPTTIADTPPGDPLTHQIDTMLAALQAEVSPQVAADLVFSGRSGEAGLSRLDAVLLPIEATVSPGGYGKLKLLLRPTALFAGALDHAPLRQADFGTQAFAISPATQAFTGRYAEGRDAKGVGLDLDYAYSWVEADIGATPLGFQQTNVVGGITLTPHLASNLSLRLVAERRAVTDSLLSYAGVTDPRTGDGMGGVIKNRFYVQLELSDGQGYWYAGAGGAALRGENVAANAEIEAGAGVNYPVWTSTTDEVRLGVNLVYFGFDKNLDNFTLGQGGYFSPQSYAAALLPVSYAEKLGKLSYMVSGAIGLQTYHEQASDYFPTSAALQTALVARAAEIPGLQTRYGSQGATGPSGSGHGEIQYEVTPALNIGGAATFQRAGNFDQVEALVYARYRFDGAP
jgi:hypothetical protein